MTLTVNGTGFVSTSVVQVNGTSESTTYVSGIKLTATVPAAQIASGGQLPVAVLNGSVSSGTSSPVKLEVDNPAPLITSISPDTEPTDAGSLAITVTGTGFVPATVINVNGSARTTTYGSATQVNVTLSAADVSAAGTLSLTAVNAAPGGGTSAPAHLQVVAPNPAPTITSLNPAIELVSAQSLNVLVTGTGFVSATTITVNGSARQTTVSSSTRAQVVLTAADVQSTGTLSVTAVSPAPGGGTSAAVMLPVNNPAVGSISLTPATLSPGGISDATITVTGQSFVPTSVVKLNGNVRKTTFVNANTLTFAITAAEQASEATYSVTVTNPPPGGGTSPAAIMTIGRTTPTPIVGSVTPSQILQDSPDTQIAVEGTGFSNASVVYWNGAPLTLLGISSSANGSILTATVPAADLAAKGTAQVTVSTPSASPSVSNAMTVTIYDYPFPAATQISPAAVALNTPTSIMVTGSGFTSASVISIDGTAMPTGFTSETSLTAEVPDAMLTMPGVLAVTVTTPAPGGGTSTPLYLTAYVPIVNNSMVYNPANGLFYLSVPSSAGVPYGNSVVPVDALTGALGTPIPVGAEPDQLAITADGHYLWVALDGASAVRKVDLQTGIAGPQFTTVQQSYGFAATALAALPNQPDSVVVATPAGNIGQSLAIYDHGVIRGTPVQATFDTYNPWALVVDGGKNEIYAAGAQQPGWTAKEYTTYTYDASGLMQKFQVGYTTNQYASQNDNEVEVVNGTLYTDFGQVYKAEDATLLGSFYSSGTTLAQGSTTVDTTLGLAFVLEGGWYSDSFQLQAFKLSDYSLASAGSIQTANPTARADYMIEGPTGNRLTRWGSDGLAYRTTGGFISLHTRLVKDLSSTHADLEVTLSASGTNSTGSATTYSAKVTNHGPASASSVALAAGMPATGVLTSATSPSASCSGMQTVLCNLGSLANGASASVTFTVQQVSAGTATLNAQVNASQNDPLLSNNQASLNLTITGGDFNLTPTIAGVSPQAVLSGSSDTTITVTGSNFAAGAEVLLSGKPLPTTFNSSTEVLATVPAADLANLGWAAISVTNPAPGGGKSAALSLTVFSAMELGANHILYDPYSRKIMAAVSSGSPSVAGNSIVAIDPATGSVGTPVAAGGTPTVLALSTDGNILYALVPDATSGSILRYNMITRQAFSVSGFQATGYETGLRDLAAQPGAENTVAVDEGEYPGISIFDFDPAAKTATRRGNATGTYTGTCLAFPSANNLLSVDLETSPSLVEEYTVTASGLVNGSYPYAVGSIIQNQNCYKVNGNFLVTESGGVASTATIPLTQLGVIEGLTSRSNYGTGVKDFDADSSLGMAYYLTNSSSSEYNQPFDSVSGYAMTTFVPETSVAIPFATIENGLSYTGLDVVRWGQDGLAVLTDHNLYLMRGPLIVPELLYNNSAAVLSASSAQTVPHGSGNTLLTLTGSNFIPGVAVTWNGNSRTTTILDATHVTVAIPASDLAATGSASVVAVNPGGLASNAITVTIN